MTRSSVSRKAFGQLFEGESVFQSLDRFHCAQAQYHDSVKKQAPRSPNQKPHDFDEYLQKELLKVERNRFIEEFLSQSNMKLMRKVFLIWTEDGGSAKPTEPLGEGDPSRAKQ